MKKNVKKVNVIKKDKDIKVVLTEKEIPSTWYNILPDLPEPLQPYLHPGTKQPVSPDDLEPIFPKALIEQELSPKRWIDIPGEIIDIYRLWRPSPLYRARNLEKALKTPAKIYYKYEGVSPAGSHKPNTAVAQAYYNKREGVKKLTTETGAGQWGSALALAGTLIGLDIEVYMVKVSYEQKPYRKLMMETWGAKVFASPTNKTEAGRAVLKEDPKSPGSLGIAISEAVEVAFKDKNAKYSLGSVLNHVLMHQTIIGLEAKKQFEKIGEYPDVVIGSCGGGSNLAGISFPFIYDKLRGKAPKLRTIAVEPTACPTLTKGKFEYDFGDVAGMTPLIKMFTLGHKFVPAGIHAGGLRYHGDSPLISLLHKNGIMEAKAYNQIPVFKAAILFAKNEGIIPAPETAHAVKAAIDEAIDAKKKNKKKVILFNFSGHGHFDLAAYESYLYKKMKDVPLTKKDLENGFKSLPLK